MLRRQGLQGPVSGVGGLEFKHDARTLEHPVNYAWGSMSCVHGTP